MRTIV